MRHLFLFCIFLVVISCQKEAIQHDNDIELIKEYLATNAINAIEDKESNLFYSIDSRGSDSISPIRDNAIIVEVKYKAYLLDGTLIYDTGNSSTKVALDESIYGWQLALPKMNVDDKILLFLPSRLAYGAEGNDNIPPNSVLVFDLELIEVFPHF
ncbi:MAG: FKBP-type peptidyl-prolyl cis-trans isomerase FklB (EC [uncultured Aureispira sp.]|uniref:Peptidyl-prolyl cis-trans isomerase n=1 Tax=uncultured Aureispira sp. TaxID=1331704 RepID=A0A6S6U922_9BACT|nr:MAG: FKBP-type peptidyl-prolyl cis-trans isomerase FklB (EC [uncultured Aureispira sp.]